MRCVKFLPLSHRIKINSIDYTLFVENLGSNPSIKITNAYFNLMQELNYTQNANAFVPLKLSSTSLSSRLFLMFFLCRLIMRFSFVSLFSEHLKTFYGRLRPQVSRSSDDIRNGGLCLKSR